MIYLLLYANGDQGHFAAQINKYSGNKFTDYQITLLPNKLNRRSQRIVKSICQRSQLRPSRVLNMLIKKLLQFVSQGACTKAGKRLISRWTDIREFPFQINLCIENGGLAPFKLPQKHRRAPSMPLVQALLDMSTRKLDHPVHSSLLSPDSFTTNSKRRLKRNLFRSVVL